MENTKHNCEEIIVEYKTIKGRVNTTLDKLLTKVANGIGLEFVGSGYNFKTKKRDLQFKTIVKK